jgi:hypothetical protein
MVNRTIWSGVIVMQSNILVAITSFAIFALPLHSQDLLGIPLKPDPPIAVDGDLGDWKAVPNAITLRDADQVVWGAGMWNDAADLSGTVHLAWRQEYLFVAADVTDDIIRQSQRGDSLWKGDHIEIYLDVLPDSESDRNYFGTGQFQIGVSPGNFEQTGDTLLDTAPEVFVYRPVTGPAAGALVASERTEHGYVVEVAIPWSLLGIEVSDGTTLRVEVGLSDTDSPEPAQETLMTTSTDTWEHTRSRLRLAALAGTDGAAKPPAKEMALFDTAKLARGESQEFSFAVDEIPAGRDAIVALKARMEFDRVAGYTPALRITVNGGTLDSDRLVNKPLRAKSRGGQVYSLAAGDRFSTYYSPDFESPDADNHYGLLDDISACDFELNVTDLVQTGENTLRVENAASESVDNILVAGEAKLLFRPPPPPAKAKAGPPTGPLERFEPARNPVEFRADDVGNGVIRITVGEETFEIASRFSTLKPEWVHGANDYFELSRSMDVRDGAVIVSDTFTNRTTENLPIMQRHEVALRDRLKGLWLSGLDQAALSGNTNDPANPTTFAATAASGIGLLPLSDVMRLHVANYGVDGIVGIADNNLVIPPGVTYIAEWAIVPTDAPEYWRFLNVARRLVGANFLIDGGFAFFRAGPLTDDWSDEQTTDFVRFKDAKYACATIDYPRYNGDYPHGTAFQRINHDNFRNSFARRRELMPGIQNLVYFHCFIDVIEDGPQRFADSRLLRPDGVQADYGQEAHKIYLPLKDNSYGPAIAKSIDLILDEIEADGVYWDEHEYSRWTYHYGEPWDGFTGDIDPTAMTVTRLKSSVTLLTERWRVDLAKHILSRGPLIGNSPPYTRAMAALKFPCFVETGSITHCTQAHLYSPIALGDHLTERSELDAYRTMLAALDYGCVYHWYNDMTVIPTHHHLTRYMFPITPLELHEGYIIGDERIITKKSGLFGWGDASKHEVHVFDDTGREVEGFNAPVITIEGRAYTELRIAEDWSAAIIRSGKDNDE